MTRPLSLLDPVIVNILSLPSRSQPSIQGVQAHRRQQSQKPISLSERDRRIKATRLHHI